MSYATTEYVSERFGLKHTVSPRNKRSYHNRCWHGRVGYGRWNSWYISDKTKPVWTWTDCQSLSIRMMFVKKCVRRPGSSTISRLHHHCPTDYTTVSVQKKHKERQDQGKGVKTSGVCQDVRIFKFLKVMVKSRQVMYPSLPDPGCSWYTGSTSVTPVLMTNLQSSIT